MMRTVTLSILLLLIVGCTESVEDVASASYRSQFLAASEPADAMSITEVAEQLDAANESDGPLPVVVVGRIYAGELEPWEANKASFILSELPAEGHGEGHDADNCPFCKRRAAKAPTAIVKFLDDKNEIIGIDSRKLFGLEPGQTVVVRGKVTRGEFDSLVLNAEQMHIR